MQIMLVEKLRREISSLSLEQKVKDSLLIKCTEIKEEIKRLESTNETDLLGDWLNRRGLFRQTERIFSEYNRGVYDTIAVAFIDLDKFKTINDVYGHKHGDEILISVANVIGESIRKIDIYGRLSGDEFVIVLPGLGVDLAKEVLSRIRIKIKSTNFLFNTEKLPISLTYGVVSTKDDRNSTFEDLLHEADSVMNLHKGDRSR